MSNEEPAEAVADEIANEARQLRNAAEARIKAAEKEARPEHDRLDPQTLRYVYELQVHQIELETQNEELRRARVEASVALARFTSLFDDAPVGYMTLDRVGTMREINRTGTVLLGFERSWLVHRRFALYVELADRRRFADFLDLVFAGAKRSSLEVALIVGARGRVVLRLDATLVTSGPEPECRVTMSDVTAQKQAEWSRDMHSAAFNAAANAIFVTDASGLIESVNAAFTSLTGYTIGDSLGQTPGALLKSGAHDNSFYADMWRALLDGKVWSGEITNRRKDGSLFVEERTITPVRSDAGAIVHYVAIGRDLTEARLVAQQLMQAQRMESVGRLAGGIAHDFNNLLTVINGTASLALRELGSADPLRQDLREIEQAGKRAAVLTRQLLAFSRKQVMSFERLDLSALLHSMRGVVRRLFGPDVAITFSVPQGTGFVRADPAQMEQVILNLVLNARDAITGGGTLTMGVRDCDLDADFAAAHRGVQVGPYVELTIADTGVGMTPETAGRVFEPFFTTKAVGEGTGLGLAMVYGIVKQSGGYVFVESTLGIGTSFTIYLPRSIHEPSTAATDHEAPVVSTDRGTETVLVVEDEPAVRRLAVRVLRSAGYQVLTATIGTDALTLLANRDVQVDLMLTDMVMPGMSGWELAEQVSLLRPEVRCIFTSGYTSNPSLAISAEIGSAHFLPKPYTAGDLTRMVRDVLNGSAPPVP